MAVPDHPDLNLRASITHDIDFSSNLGKHQLKFPNAMNQNVNMQNLPPYRPYR